MSKESQSYFKGTSKEIPEFIENQLLDKEGYPVVDENLKKIIEKYNLIRESYSNVTVENSESNSDNNLKKKDIQLRNEAAKDWKKVYGSLSYYNRDGMIRLSDHWNEEHADITHQANFPTDRNHIYVAQKNDTRKWDLLETVPLYRTQPASPSIENRHLKVYFDKILKEFQEISQSKIYILKDIFDLRLDDNIAGELRGWLGNLYPLFSENSYLQTPVSLFEFIEKLENKLVCQKDTYTIEKFGTLIKVLKQNLLTKDILDLTEKYNQLVAEIKRERYHDDDYSSEYW